MVYFKSLLPVMLFGCLAGCTSSTPIPADTTISDAGADKRPLSAEELAEVAQLEVIDEKVELKDPEQTALVTVLEGTKSQQQEKQADEPTRDKAVPVSALAVEPVESVTAELAPAPEVMSEPEALPKAQSFEVRENQRRFGTEEWVFVPGVNRSFSASVSADVDISLIKTEDMSVFERNGREWVRFTLDKESEMNLPITIWLEKRPVVTTWIQVGDYRDRVTFVLMNKIPSEHRLLLGKNFLRDTAVIDSSKKYLQPKKQ